MVSAQICVDGIYYDRTDDKNYKEVIKNPNGYFGEVTIQASFVNGIKVTEIDHQAFENATVTASTSSHHNRKNWCWSLFCVQ